MSDKAKKELTEEELKKAAGGRMSRPSPEGGRYEEAEGNDGKPRDADQIEDAD